MSVCVHVYAVMQYMFLDASLAQVWQGLFVERSPISEACQGVVTTLHRLGASNVFVSDFILIWFGILPCSSSFFGSAGNNRRLGLEKLLAERDLTGIRAWFQKQPLDPPRFHYKRLGGVEHGLEKAVVDTV